MLFEQFFMSVRAWMLSGRRQKGAFRVTFVAIAMDMSPDYTDSVTYNIPETIIIYDRLHIIKLYNQKLNFPR